MCVYLSRPVASPDVVSDGLLFIFGPVGLGKVMSQFFHPAVQLIGVNSLDGLSHLAVQTGAATDVQLLVERLGDERVLKGIDLACTGLRRLDQLRGDGFIQGVQGGVFIQVSDGQQQIQGEAATNDCRLCQKPGTLWTHLIQAVADGSVDALGDAQCGPISLGPGRPVWVKRVFFHQCLDDLFHEERIAFGLFVDSVYDSRHNLGGAHGSGHIADGLAVKLAQRKAGDQPLLVEFYQHLLQWVSACEFGLSIGAQGEHGDVVNVTRKVLQQKQTCLVGPLKVVEEEDDRALGGDSSQEGSHVVEQPHSFLRAVQRRVGSDEVQLLAQSGDEPCQLGRRRAHLPAQRFYRLAGGVVLKGGGEGAVGHGDFLLVAATPQHGCPLQPGVDHQFADQASLADARFAGKQHHVGLSFHSTLPVRF